MVVSKNSTHSRHCHRAQTPGGWQRVFGPFPRRFCMKSTSIVIKYPPDDKIPNDRNRVKQGLFRCFLQTPPPTFAHGHTHPARPPAKARNTSPRSDNHCEEALSRGPTSRSRNSVQYRRHIHTKHLAPETTSERITILHIVDTSMNSTNTRLHLNRIEAWENQWRA